MKSRDPAEKVLHDLQALIIYQFDQLVFRLSGYIDHNDGVGFFSVNFIVMMVGDIQNFLHVHL